MLVVACPCALVISTPITYICGIATAARSGILVKGGQHLEVLAAVRRLAMDKTGTLTEGKFKMNDLVLLPTAASKGGKGGEGTTSDATVSKRDVLCLLAAVEEQSSHPLAAALVAAADEGGALPLPPSLVVDQFAIVPGEVRWGREGEEGGREGGREGRDVRGRGGREGAEGGGRRGAGPRGKRREREGRGGGGGREEAEENNRRGTRSTRSPPSWTCMPTSAMVAGSK
jgi:hypothetical protein